MIDKTCLKIMSSPCVRDYKNRHYWEKQGVIMINGYIYNIWQCMQCGYYVREKLRFLTNGVKKWMLVKE